MLQNAATQALIAQILEAQRRASPAEEAEPKAEQAPHPKPKAPPLAKPKSKPKPQAPHPQSPPPPPLVARKGAAAVPEEEPAEVKEARGELKGFLDSRAASKAAKTRAEGKVSAWEAKLASLREEGAEEERIRWGEANLRKAKLKVAEKQEAIEGFDWAVRRSERELAAVVARVKDEEVDEVVEVDVQGELEEASVKDDEEEMKVVEAAPARGGDEPVAQGVDGVEGCRGHPGPAMGPGSRGLPPPPKPGHPPPRRPGESGMDSPVFVGAGAPPAVGGGAVGLGGRGGGGGLSTLTSPCAWGWSRGRGGGNVSCRRRGTSDGGRCPPPPPKGG